MDVEKFYWEIFAAVFSAGWVGIVFLRDRIAQSLAMTSALLARLMEFEKLNLEHPEIQQYLSQHAAHEQAFFYDEDNLRDTIFIQAKTMVYAQLNLFDELLSVAAMTRGVWAPLMPSIIEKQDWEGYVKVKLRHPFYQAILNREADSYGAALRAFWEKHKTSIGAKLAHPLVW